MKYLSLAIGIAVFSIVLWSWFIPAPFAWILVWVVSLNIYAYIRMSPNPKVTKILGDLKTTTMFSLKSFLCVTIFFILRGYLTQLIDFTPFQVWTQFSSTGGAKSFLNYPAGKIIYELLFLLGVGWITTGAVFKKSKKCIYGISIFLFIAFGAQTMIYARYNGSQTAGALSAPLTDENVAGKIAAGGTVGGSYHLTKEVLFGPPKSKPTPPPRNLDWLAQKVTATSTRVCRVYNGDWFHYRNAAHGFWVIGSDLDEYYHNPTKPSEEREFDFSDIPPEGIDIFIYSDSLFDMDFRIIRKK
ncbi:hypothetical protein COT99_01145 [Candidatus Falkowbacteria bacterium CG10_big_fil_rev_8_21_14_0_10_43_10]|uniref:Uncharacterized protein n=1 Tax=Candidatus Falkowbacteria bacterium CG10_big_fil_rev_8_21_14_0_10_43_10 TaxID=1974567 RepID=A0A2H0V4J5_9BACT|nr:MAG: hypothetical protein COT99_01145 [Candidatus Falkowbacteria bacterium CG10_big_fil_rev_8_21_14_0_10_43_10]